MKIACRTNRLIHAFLLSICFAAGISFLPTGGFAEPPAPNPTSGAPAAEPAPSALPPTLQAPTIVPPAAKIEGPKEASTSVASLESALPVPASPKNAKPIEATDIRVPDSVKEAIRRLDAAETMTLDDLNNARQAIAKIDALIEIEKKLNELDKLRQEHDSNAKPLAAAIPASAINALPPPSLPQFTPPPLPSLPPMNMSHNVEPPPVFNSGPSGEISRIIGTGGRYIAMIKSGDTTKTIEVGDHFDGGIVSNISATSIQIDEGKTTRTLHIKNVENVFGSNTN